ncbi:MAG: ABC transporter permease [Firmicutes bacterium]|nr:ABC transporter permease [Bacillota bacterium]
MRKFISTEKIKELINKDTKIIPTIFILILLVFWQFVVDIGLIERYILPSPKNIILTLIKILPEIKIHVVATLQEAISGFSIAIILSIILAVLMDSIKIIKKAIYPLLIISQTVPIIALAPLFMMWFGLGKLPKIIVVVLVCFFPIVISLLDGLESVDKDMLNLIKSMGGSKFQIFKIVKFPSSIVSFFSGLRIAATYSIMGAVIGEWLGGKEGLGLYMLRAKHAFKLDKVFAVIIVIVILSMTLFKIISLMQYLFMPWTRES